MNSALFLLSVFAASVGAVAWHETRPERVTEREEKAAQIAAEALPRKINEANGCEVWAFKPADRWLYFTRCQAKTETTNTWKECRTVTAGTECTPRSAVISQEPSNR